MRPKKLLLAALLSVCSQTGIGGDPVSNGRNVQGASALVGAQDRIQDGIGTQHLVAGIFQRYDPSRGVIRVSDVDYDLNPSLAKLGSKLREFRNGQTVLFTQAGVSKAGRNVLTSIEPQ